MGKVVTADEAVVISGFLADDGAERASPLGVGARAHRGSGTGVAALYIGVGQDLALVRER
ncbi:hypothetical protein [Streptomyces sp. NPDC057616]|uniref:hypothetical protein n=1 Tax=Streptomyces sp. NPDC057616 TaxID=3346183 RepID=UPI0036CFC2F6